MNFRLQLSKFRRLLLRVARHLQLIVIVLFLLYGVSAVTILFGLQQLDSHGVALGAAILLIAPLPIFACEILAVFVRWPPGSYLCVALWVLAGVWAFLTSLVIASRSSSSSSLVDAFVFVSIGLAALLLASLHFVWPRLLHDSHKG